MVYDVRDLGAVGDGMSDDSAVFVEAIGRCRRDGGGTVTVPAGCYLIKPLRPVLIQLKDCLAVEGIARYCLSVPNGK